MVLTKINRQLRIAGLLYLVSALLLAACWGYLAYPGVIKNSCSAPVIFWFLLFGSLLATITAISGFIFVVKSKSKTRRLLFLMGFATVALVMLAAYLIFGVIVAIALIGLPCANLQ